MIECIFSVDYEIYGNGEGTLRQLVYEPADKLIKIFGNWNASFVCFVEVAEFELIQKHGTDPDIDSVIAQIQDLRTMGFELGLHLHPQWYNARFEKNRWMLDYSEYNLCTLTNERIAQLIKRALSYFKKILGDSDFNPISFRAGNWLFQPSKIVAKELAAHGIKIDSSVFKGGIQHKYSLDYRKSLKNGYFWKFSDDINCQDSKGILLEIPIYTKMVPIWKVPSSSSILNQTTKTVYKSLSDKLGRFHDFFRLLYPLKLDFCKISSEEFIRIFNTIIEEDRLNPSVYRPIVSIGHTKDLYDYDSIEYILSYLRKNKIIISTFEDLLKRRLCNFF